MSGKIRWQRATQKLAQYLAAAALVLCVLTGSRPEEQAALAATTTTITVASGTCGKTAADNVTWTVTKESESSTDYTLTISGTGEMAGYALTSEVPWTAHSGNITTVIVESGVTSIGDNAFVYCTRLSSVTLPKGITCIGEYAFGYCSSLTNITIPEGVLSIEKGVFGYCSELESVTILEGVTSIGDGAFYECKSLTFIELPESVTSIERNAFSACKNLASIELPEGVTSIGAYAFNSCSKLTSIVLPEGITSIAEGMFTNCTELTEVTIPEGVTSIGARAFDSCSKLASIELPEGITSIGEYAFSNCSSLTSIVLPAGVKSIERKTFYGCSKLSSITIPEGVTSIVANAFQDCTELTTVYVPHSWNNSIYTFPENVTVVKDQHEGSGTYFLNGDGTELQDRCSQTGCYENAGTVSMESGRVYNGKPYTAIKETGSMVGGKGTKFTVSYQKKEGDSWKTISEAPTDVGEYKVTVTAGTGTTPPTISDEFAITKRILTPEVTVASQVEFRTDGNYASEISVNLKNRPAGVTLTKDTDYTVSMNVVAADKNKCGGEVTATVTITLRDNATNANNTTNYALDAAGNTSVSKQVTFSTNPVSGTCGVSGAESSVIWTLTGTPGNYTLTISGSGAMEDYSNLDKVPWTTYTSEITKVTVESGVTSIGQNAFYGCTDLEQVQLPAGLESIGSNAFWYCLNLQNITLPNQVSIGTCAFSYTGLTEITIPGEAKIGESAFSGCTSLGKVIVESGGKIIAKQAFFSCSKLKNVTLPTGLETVGESAFYGCTELTEITVPSGAEIGVAAFFSCTKLGNVVLDGVTSIGDQAFSGCTGLTTLTIPASVTSLARNAFTGCTGLTSVTMPCYLEYDFAALNSSVVVTRPHGSKGYTYPISSSPANAATNTAATAVLKEHCTACGTDCGTATLRCADVWYDGATSANATLVLDGTLENAGSAGTGSGNAGGIAGGSGATGGSSSAGGTGTSAPTIYYKVKGTDQKLSAAPTEVGSYTAFVDVPVNDSNASPKTIQVDFEIKYADITAVATGSAEAGWQKSAVISAPVGYKISTAVDGTYADALPEIFSSSTSTAGTKVTYYLKQDTTGYISAPKTITVFVDSQNPSIQSSASMIAASTTDFEINVGDLLTQVKCCYLLKTEMDWSISAEDVLTDGTEVCSGVTSAQKTITLTGLAPNSDYTFYVAVKDAAGNTSMSHTSFTTLLSGKSVSLARNYYFGKSYADQIDLSAYATKCQNPVYQITATGSGLSGGTGTATGSGLSGSTGSSTGTATGSGLSVGSVFSAGPSISGSTVSYTTKPGSIGDSASFEVTITSDNSDPITVTISVNLIGKLPVVLQTGSKVEAAGSLTYGQLLSKLGFANAVFVDAANSSKTVAGTLSWENGSLLLGAGTPTVNWIFTSSEEEYAGTSGTTTITVNKAQTAPNAPETTKNISYDEAATVGEVSLPTDWVWRTDQQSMALTAGTPVKATAVYDGADKGNYTVESVEISITRALCQHTGGTATCKDKAVCTLCQKPYGELDLTKHTGGTATCKDKAVCTLCQKPYGEVDSKNHVGDTEVIGYQAPSVDNEGYTGDTYCKSCNAKLESGKSIPKLTPTPTPTSTPTPTPTSTPTPTPTSTPTPTPTSTPTPKPTYPPVIWIITEPTPTPTPTKAPAYNPETEWAPKDALKAWEKFYEVLLGTSKKNASMIGTLNVGETIDLNFYGVKNWTKNGYTYRWTSSDESVATVDELGNVTMHSEGIAIIRLELIEKATGRKLSVAPMFVGTPERSYRVFLGTSAKDAKILWELSPDGELDLNFYGVKNWKKENYTYLWTSSDEDIATVDNKGVVTAKKSGIVLISLQLKDLQTGEYLKVAPVLMTISEQKKEMQ